MDKITEKQLGMISWQFQHHDLNKYLISRIERKGSQEVNYAQADFSAWLAREMDKHLASVLIEALQAQRFPEVLNQLQHIGAPIQYAK